VNLAHFPVAYPAPDQSVEPAVLEALDCLRVAVTIFDSDERLIYSNKHFNYLFRSMPRRESLVGLSYEEMIRLEVEGGEIAHDSLADLADFISHRRSQFREGEYKPFDIHLADGRIIEIKARRTTEGGWIALWGDATQARHLLCRLEDTIELTADAFAFWDRRDRMILCNTVFAELHGHASPEEMAGMSFGDVLSEAVRRGQFSIEGETESWTEQRLEAHRSPAGALSVATASGAVFLVRERATRDGGSATVFTDATDKHRVEVALVEQTRALTAARKAFQKTKTAAKRQASYLADLTRRLSEVETEADTAKTALLRTMSHELKTPLNAIIGFSDVLRSAPDRFQPPQIEEYASLIHRAGGNLLRLINQILDLTKLAAGRYALRRQPVDARASLFAALDINVARAQERGTRVIVEDGQADIRVDADESALSHMVGQLLENAVNFTPTGSEVRLRAVRAGDAVRICVSDNGPGVAEGDLARILEPFEQVGRGTTDHANGAGLGLPLVKALIELHGGSLAIASAPGKGFAATLELPAI